MGKLYPARTRLAFTSAILLSVLVAGASRDVIDIPSPTGDSSIPNRPVLSQGGGQHLAVVVPAYQGDLDRTVASLERWPSNCSPLTVENVDLVLYYAEGEEDKSAVEEAAGVIAATAGRCFANLRVVYAHLREEVRLGPSHAYVRACVRASKRVTPLLPRVCGPSPPIK